MQCLDVFDQTPFISMFIVVVLLASFCRECWTLRIRFLKDRRSMSENEVDSVRLKYPSFRSSALLTGQRFESDFHLVLCFKVRCWVNGWLITSLNTTTSIALNICCVKSAAFK